MDEFERNEMSENSAEEAKEEPKVQENTERNTNAPSGWTYSANTNQYVSWDGNGDPNSAQWNPGYQQRAEQQPDRKSNANRERDHQGGTAHGTLGNLIDLLIEDVHRGLGKHDDHTDNEGKNRKRRRARGKLHTELISDGHKSNLHRRQKQDET